LIADCHDVVRDGAYSHDLRQDRLLCLSCNAEDLRQRRDSHQPPQHPMDEVPPQ
jgi:hypothetical protein